jgi:hypothetical protein
MNLQEMLNGEVDLKAIAAVARQGWSWWVGELAEMAPRAWRARLSRAPQLWAEREANGQWTFFRDGRRLAGRPEGGERIGVRLHASDVLTRTVSIPRMPMADARRMVSLNIERLSPLAPDLIHHDLEILDRDAETGLTVLLGIVRRGAAADLLAAARAAGLRPAAMAVAVDGDQESSRFDFLPAVSAAAGEPVSGRPVRYAWGAVAVLLVMNLTLLVGRDIARVQQLNDLVEAQRPAVNTVLTLQKRIEGENARRRALLDRGAQAEPLRVLGILTSALPQSAWVRRLEWNGRSLHIAGDEVGDADLVTATRASGAFVNARSAGKEVVGATPGLKSFDITADARPAPAVGGRR